MAAINPALLPQPHTESQASVSEPLRVLRVLRDLRLLAPAATAAPRRSKAPATPLRHRSTRTLNPLADAPPHHASPISITTPHKPPSSNHRDATGAYLWHALLIYCTDRSTSFGMPSSVASVSHFRFIRVIRVLYCRSFGVLPSAAHLQSKTSGGPPNFFGENALSLHEI